MNFDKLERKLSLISYLREFDIESSPDNTIYYISCKNYNDDYLPIEAAVDVNNKTIEYNFLYNLDTPLNKQAIDTAQLDDLRNFINILLEDN